MLGGFWDRFYVYWHRFLSRGVNKKEHESMWVKVYLRFPLISGGAIIVAEGYCCWRNGMV